MRSPYEGEIVGFRVAGAVGAPAFPAVAVPAAPSPAPRKFQRRPWRSPESGKPFFPLGWFAWHSDADDREALARENASKVLFAEAPTEVAAARFPGNLKRMLACLDQAHRLGIKVLMASWEKPPFAVSHNHGGITRSLLPDLVPDIATLALEDETHFYLIAVDNSAVFLDVSFRINLPGLEGRKTARQLF